MATHPLGVALVQAGRIIRGWQQPLMGEGIGYRGNCRGCLYFAKPLIVDKEERAITLQWPSDSGAELIADKLAGSDCRPNRSSSWRRVTHPDAIPTKIRETGYCLTS